jgi:hypothetical protein
MDIDGLESSRLTKWYKPRKCAQAIVGNWNHAKVLRLSYSPLLFIFQLGFGFSEFFIETGRLFAKFKPLPQDSKFFFFSGVEPSPSLALKVKEKMPNPKMLSRRSAFPGYGFSSVLN